jgi:hypothetical protein
MNHSVYTRSRSGDRLATVLQRFEGVRAYGPGYRARCPAHHGKRGSVAIRRSERDGRILVHCFKGCETADVLRACGLDLRDLFDEEPLARDRRRPVRRPSQPTDVRAFVKAEMRRAARDRRERRPWDFAERRSADVNEAIHRANVAFGLSRPSIAPFPWEGFTPFDDDPLWPVLYERALAFARWVAPNANEATMTIFASERAALELHEVARRGC